MLPAIRTSAAASGIVTLAEAKAQCRVTASDEDTLITGLIATATAMVAEMSGRVLGLETWKWSFRVQSGAVEFPRAPVRAVTSIAYLDPTWAAQTATLADFYATTDDPDRPAIAPMLGKSWPTTAARDDAITVTFTAGYTSVPPELKQAILLLIGHLYSNREASVAAALEELPMGVQSLVSLHRRGWVEA